MSWEAIAIYAAGAALALAAGWAATRLLPRWRHRRTELQSALVVLAMLATGTLVVPRVLAATRVSALRSAGTLLFGDEGSGELYARRLAPIIADGRLEARAAAVAPAGANASDAAVLAYVGMARLSATDLARYLELRRALAERSPALCAALWKGNVGSNTLAAGLHTLDAASKAVWIDLEARAAELELAATTATTPLAADAVAAAWTALFERLPAERRALLERAGRDHSTLADADACQAFLTVAAEAPRLPSQTRDTLITALTCPFAVARP